MQSTTRLTFGDFGVGAAAAVLVGAAMGWLLASAPSEPPPRTLSVVASIAPAGGGGGGSPGARTESVGDRPRPADSVRPPREPVPSRPTQPRKPGRKGTTAATTESPAASGDGGGGDGSGEGAPGSGEGSGAPSLDAESIAAYRAELLGWLSGRFVVERSGLDTETLAALKVRASVEIAADGTVSGFSLVGPSGHEVVDQAVRDALEPLVGRAVPTPPEGYPGGLPPKLTVTFVCSESRCS